MISDTTANAILNALCNNTSLAYTNLYASMHTADPGVTGANEFAGGSYARSGALSFATAASRACSTDAAKNDGVASAQTATHMGLWTAASAGTFVWGGKLATDRTFTDGQNFEIASGDIDLNL
jgi:hypothetical protein